MITMEGNINLDFRDVKKILKNGGVAIMSTGIASGERRLKHAIDDALKSPLLNDNDISKAKKILFNISWSKDAPLLIEETNEIDSFMESLDKNIEVIWGEAEDTSLGENVKFTVLATGFGSSSIPGMEQLQHQRSKEEVEAQEEREAQEQERIDRIYGRNTQKKRPHHLPYILTADDFDNDELIQAIENSPTYLRNRTTLNQLKEKSTETVKPVDETPVNDDGIIHFG